jgi:hypothetical protein
MNSNLMLEKKRKRKERKMEGRMEGERKKEGKKERVSNQSGTMAHAYNPNT